MNIYAVGGAIRDELLGLPIKDYDYVVVGGTPEQMITQGYRPVGQDFPVFLHPSTQAEYALARTERKTALGYHGFQFYYAPDVTLEQDLARRDLTINAMARAVDLEGKPIGPIIDPYQGQTDLTAGILRHVSSSFTEDPVRILRAARFAARLPSFTLASETLALMGSMVTAGEVDALVPERVWQEISQGLMTDHAWRMFDLLHDCGALARILPELEQLFNEPGTATTDNISAPTLTTDNNATPAMSDLERARAAIQRATAQGYKLSVRFATLIIALIPGLKFPSETEAKKKAQKLMLNTLCLRLKVPSSCRDLALLAAREIDAINNSISSSPSKLVQLLERCDALRKPARFAETVQTCEASYYPVTTQQTPYSQADRLREVLIAMRSVDAGTIAAQSPNEPTLIKQAVHEARIAAVKAALLNSI